MALKIKFRANCTRESADCAKIDNFVSWEPAFSQSRGNTGLWERLFGKNKLGIHVTVSGGVVMQLSSQTDFITYVIIVNYRLLF